MYRNDLAHRPKQNAARRSEPPEPVAGLLGELARAMLVAAEHERDRLVANLVDEADAQAHKVRSRALAEATEFQRLADEDVDEIHARTVAEIERIRTRAERRIVVRRGRLERHLVGHAAVIESEIARIDVAVEDYGRELDGFFGRLRGERNPREIARLAEALPATPAFDELRADARADAVARLSGNGSAHVAGSPVDRVAIDGEGSPIASDPVEVAASLVGVMDPAAAPPRHGASPIARVMRTLSGLTSSTDRSG